MHVTSWAIGGVVLLAGAIAAPAQDAAARAAAATMQQKLTTIATRGTLPASSSPLPIHRTSFTDRELNAFFRVNGPEFLPTGVVEPQVTIDRAGQVRFRATVDLDLALRPKERGWLDPLAYLGGKVEVAGAGALHAANGRGVFRLENATLGGVSVPRAVLQEIITYYSRSEALPRGFQLDEPFELPSSIRSIETAPGRATVVQ